MSKGYVLAYNGMDTGLGNRVRVVLSTQILAEQEDRRLLYVWPTGPRFGPRFQDLFEFDEGRVVPRSVSRLLARRQPYLDASLTWLDDDVRRRRLWQIRTGRPLDLPAGSPTWGERLRHLVPAADVATRVRQLFDEELWGRRYVGVMIRAHAVSHEATKKASPVEWFVDRMQQIRAAHPDVLFFVCCDVPEVQERVSRLLGGCVGQVDKGGYNTVEGVKSSVVDLYLLAASHHLVAPHYSSFIHMAQHLGGDVVPIETSQTPTPESVELEALGHVEDPVRPWRRS